MPPNRASASEIGGAGSAGGAGVALGTVGSGSWVKDVTNVAHTVVLRQRKNLPAREICSWCAGEESNLHSLAATTPSKWRVYHFTTRARSIEAVAV